MAVVYNSPGIYAVEQNFSQYTKTPSNTILAVVTPASAGPVNVAILVTNYNDIVNNFGYPAEIYPGLLVVRDFCAAGGTQAFVVRVAEADVAATTSLLLNTGTETVLVGDGGTFHAADTMNLVFHSTHLTGSPVTVTATSITDLPTSAAALVTAVNANAVLTEAGITTSAVGALITVLYPTALGLTFTESVSGGGATTTLTLTAGAYNAPISVPAATTGTFFDQMTMAVSYGHQKTFTTTAAPMTLVATSSQVEVHLSGQKPLVPGTITLKYGGTIVATDDQDGNLVFQSAPVVSALGSGAAATGTVNYDTGTLSVTITGEVGTPTVTVTILGSYWSTFSLALSYTLLDTNSNVITTYPLASYGNLTPANVATALAGNAYLAFPSGTLGDFPSVGTYAFSGGDDGIDELTDANYVGDPAIPSGMQIFAFPDQLKVNVLCIPGQGSSVAVQEAAVELVTESRMDCLFVTAPPLDATTPQQAADWANGAGAYSSFPEINNTYTAIYYPWYQTYNSSNNAFENTPPEAAALTAMAQSAYYEAPAGPNRGMIVNATSIRSLSAGDREFLADERINPISNIQNMGLMVGGQLTATLFPSSLDRIGARNTLMRLEQTCIIATFPVLFELDNPATWTRVINIIQPILKNFTALGILNGGQVFCDQTTNTADVINNNQLVAQIVVQLPKYAEQIILAFIATEVGVSITESSAPIPGVAT